MEYIMDNQPIPDLIAYHDSSILQDFIGGFHNHVFETSLFILIGLITLIIVSFVAYTVFKMDRKSLYNLWCMNIMLFSCFAGSISFIIMPIIGYFG